MTTKNFGRNNGGRFAKGHSGNMKGRPRKAPRAFLPMQHEIDFLEAMEQGIPVTRSDGERTTRPAVLVLIDQAIMAAIKDPDPKTIMALLDRYLKILEKNRVAYVQEEQSLKLLDEEIPKAKGEQLSELKQLQAYLRWKTQKH